MRHTGLHRNNATVPLLAALGWSLLPLLWQLLTSLRTPEALVLQGPSAWLQGWTLANYRQVLLSR